MLKHKRKSEIKNGIIKNLEKKIRSKQHIINKQKVTNNSLMATNQILRYQNLLLTKQLSSNIKNQTPQHNNKANISGAKVETNDSQQLCITSGKL